MLSSQQLVINALKKIKEVSVNELVLLKPKGINLLDVREADEVALGVIPGSIWVARGLLEFQIQAIVEQLNWNVKDEIYITCRSGNRSALAALTLLEMGFSKPISVAGGFNAWRDSNYPVSMDVLHF